MVIQAVVDIDVDVDFGLAKALRICQGCGIRSITSDSIRKSISIAMVRDIEEKIRCLSSIKGFFTVDLRLFVELCNLDNNMLRAIGVTPTPRIISSRILGYMYVDNKLCVFLKTSRKNIALVRVLKSMTMPTFLEPSLYLIQAPSGEVVSKVLDTLNTLRALEDKLSIIIAKVCIEKSRA